jgi:uncharacterized protein (DUF433 family)
MQERRSTKSGCISNQEVARMNDQHIEQRNGGYYIKGTRISLDSVVYAYLNGLSPENIVESFPLLTLEQVNGGIAYYEAHREEIDRYLKESEAEFEILRQATREANPALRKKLEEARAQLEAEQRS